GVRFTSDGQHVIGTYLESNTWEEFRVFETETMEEVGALDYFTGFEFADVWEDTYVAYAIPLLGPKYLSFVDLTDPTNPELISTVNVEASDAYLDEAGRLFVCTGDVLRVYRVADQLELDGLISTGDAFVRVDGHGDELYVYQEESGLSVYRWNNDEMALDLLRHLGPLPLGVPTKMAAGPRALHAGYTEYGLYAYDRMSLAELDYYRTGLDFVFPFWWKLEDLQVFGDMVAITEYFGQTSLLRFIDTTTSVRAVSTGQPGTLYPNPTSGSVHMTESFAEAAGYPVRLTVFNLRGQVILTHTSYGTAVDLDLPDGVFVLILEDACGKKWKQQIIVAH
ncbi:MAG: T9SS type A sorting domain-containing protein, partial [Saprospiraceae bacterium]|nr:T9SS type A sorting domain-containing protein [Saprospiraceae bacterium]